MQQAICHPDQLGNQQPMVQQMVLCPVKLVYDTQILVQPGEQIQPNQTLFLNPQNPPPWVQNRMQNQILYVQQMPNNMVSQYQPQMDPNAVYIQNYPYQIQQQMLTQNPQEQRSMQVATLPANMMQSMPNIQNIVNMQNERQTPINSFQIPQQMVARQVAPNIAFSQINNQMHQQHLEVQRPVMSIRPQIAVNTNFRPQVVSANTSNTQQSIRQTFAPVINQQRPIPPSNSANIRHIMQPVFTKSTNTQTPPRNLNTMSSEATAPSNKSTTTVSTLRNLPNYPYRPIQPRPQYRHNMPNIGMLTQPISQIQTLQNKNYIQQNDNRINNISTANTTANITNVSNKPTAPTNRKRKSESPDEVEKKISVINPVALDTNTSKQSNITLNYVTMPKEISIIRSEDRVLNLSSSATSVQNSAQIVKLVDNGQQTNAIETPVTQPVSVSSQMTPNEKDKLVRNTVFTQARGRLLNDKEIMPNTMNVTDEKPVDSSKDATEVENKAPEEVKVDNVEIVTENTNLTTLRDQQDELNKSSKTRENTDTVTEVRTNREIDTTQQILTHVLDGYVIQESNIAFPIRKPLQEKILYENIRTEKEAAAEKLNAETMLGNKPADLPQLPIQNLQLDNDKKDMKIEPEKVTPFSALSSVTVKSWTVNQLGKHLAKHNWNETESILREHEIDGESLFLVSKAQLVQIGIGEEHADVICDFVKN